MNLKINIVRIYILSIVALIVALFDRIAEIIVICISKQILSHYVTADHSWRSTELFVGEFVEIWSVCRFENVLLSGFAIMSIFINAFVIRCVLRVIESAFVHYLHFVDIVYLVLNF
jgi:hypothetical protein